MRAETIIEPANGAIRAFWNCAIFARTEFVIARMRAFCGIHHRHRRHVRLRRQTNGSLSPLIRSQPPRLDCGYDR
jgi:hypothetical protein